MTAVSPPVSRRLRRFIPNPVFAATTAALWAVHLILGYPLSYLVVPARDIWFVQLGTWIFIFGEAILLGVAAGWLIEGIRRCITSIPVPRRIAEAAISVESALTWKQAPLVVGAISTLVAAYAQGPLRSVPFVHDEAAYLMQAKLLASGHWRGPAAPIPAFFEQMYVFVWPFMAAKYPPGFPIALVPGVWIGTPFLVPILLVAITAGLIFALGREIAGPWVALSVVLLWITNPHGAAGPVRFMSEQLSTMLVVASWWALGRWRKSERMNDLLLLALFVGWGAITRPLTMFAFAVPIAVVVFRKVLQTRRWGDLASAAGVGLAVLLVLPLWCQQTTGDWKVSPLALHVRWYTPYDALGFGPPPAPIRTLPPDLRQVSTTIRRSRERHRYVDIPRLIVERLVYLSRDAFPGWRVVFLPFLAGGLFLSRGDVVFAAASVAGDFAAYLALSHPAHLTKYYLDSYPAIFFIAAIGVWAMVPGCEALEPSGAKKPETRAIAGLGLMLLLTTAGVGGVAQFRAAQMAEAARKEQFVDKISAIPSPRAMVFVRYGPAHNPARSLIENDADLARERVWIVYDRGADNARLRAVAPDRAPFLYLEERDSLIRLDRPLTPEDEKLVGASGATLTSSRAEGRPAPPDTRTSPVREDSSSASR